MVGKSKRGVALIDRTARIANIKTKGFNMNLAEDFVNEAYTPDSLQNIPIDFSKIKIGIKTLDDAVLTLGSFKKINPRLADKKEVLQAIDRCNILKLREISDFFYRTSGIYQRLCRYMAYLYKYDWFITPYIDEEIGLLTDNEISDKERNKVFSGFFKVLKYFDNSEVKRIFGEIALKVIRRGCYYGYLKPNKNRFIIQELPVAYCRSRFTVDGRPAIEFNMAFFDDMFMDTTQRTKILNLFPTEFKKGYEAFKKGKLKPDFQGDTAGWYLLDVKNSIKFNLNGEDFPPFISVIPAIINLDEAQELDRKKMAQRLLKIIIQKMPFDKNGDLVFDVDEAKELHNNAVRMLQKAIGIDVLTTFADVEVADMSDKNTRTGTDELEKIERAVYNEAGVSQLQFNSDGNTALNNSILNDEASMYNLVSQFEAFMNYLLENFDKKPKNAYYTAQILTTTIYNYKEMAKLYKEQAQMGYSKMLPQVALGQSQSSILANAYFENDILDLVSVFVPPLTSNTMNADALNSRKQAQSKNGETTNETAGRPEKEDSQKSDKTIQNRESM